MMEGKYIALSTKRRHIIDIRKDISLLLFVQDGRHISMVISMINNSTQMLFFYINLYGSSLIFVFNATFNNMSVISWMKPQYQEKSTNQ